ncbi:MAG: hypothetical protein LAT76_01215 [Schleiferiaceae bacterium]|nr:hypothetical protein [Schleiferiaceae bacterium]
MKKNANKSPLFKKPEYSVPEGYFEQKTTQLKRIPMQQQFHVKTVLLRVGMAASVLLALFFGQRYLLTTSNEVPFWETFEFQMESSEVVYLDYLLPELSIEDLEADFWEDEFVEYEAEWYWHQEQWEVLED